MERSILICCAESLDVRQARADAPSSHLPCTDRALIRVEVVPAIPIIKLRLLMVALRAHLPGMPRESQAWTNALPQFELLPSYVPSSIAPSQVRFTDHKTPFSQGPTSHVESRREGSRDVDGTART